MFENPEPGTRNPEPGTRNPEPGTRNPEPGTLFSPLAMHQRQPLWNGGKFHWQWT